MNIILNVHSLNNRACGRCKGLNLVTSHRSESSYSHTPGVRFGSINAFIRVWSRSCNKHLIRSRSTMDPNLRTQLTWIKWFHLECVITFTMRKRVLQMLPEKKWRDNSGPNEWCLNNQEILLQEKTKKIKKWLLKNCREYHNNNSMSRALHNSMHEFFFFTLFFSILNELTIL